MNSKHQNPPAEQDQESAPKPQLIQELETKVQQAEDQKNRALADYQNLLRRTQEERVRTAKLATQSLVADLIQPLDHLALAAAQLNDTGLNMVVGQFWQALNDNGLQELNPMGQNFDPLTMEVVEKQGEGETVIKVLAKGYTLNGEVIRVAKVVVGSPEESLKKDS
jgi:molecular chaperone GrpE